MLSEQNSDKGVPMEVRRNYGVEDPLAEATYGRLHWGDIGMDDFEQGEEGFLVGMRVEVRTKVGWRLGIIMSTPLENGRAIEVQCDEPYSDNKDFFNGRGATVPFMLNTRRGIWSNIRKVYPYINLDEVQQEIEKLLALLKDRQPGMMGWNMFLNERLNKVHTLISSALKNQFSKI